MVMKSAWLLFVLSLVSVGGFPQEQPPSCPLENAKDGQTITVRGRTLDEPHDLGFAVAGCDDVIILTFAGDQDTNIGAAELRRDRSLKNFEKFTRHGKVVGATLTGKLEIATIPPGTTKDGMGFLRDASGKIVGTSGFGHPSRMFKYRLVMLSVSDVKSLKLPNGH